MQIICRGAESIIHLGRYQGKEVIIKERIKKNYRISKIDEKIRKNRTKKEAKLLTEARRVGVPTPKILLVDNVGYKIIMENLIDGKRIKEFLNSSDRKTIQKTCFEIGRSIGKLHSIGIIHGDLTTSNMILRKEKIYFIDFGLGYFSKKIEDQGTDLRLLHEALKSTHFKILDICWKKIMEGYKKEYSNADQIIKKIEEIKKRARYMER
ncbi:MAG: KEOPS complex kinase/ATPase Bud32 [Candidatus Aenigmarchaeota archaeon]|nr:KEOPS complex kinase/ATPase Bud32 [Candidatus Aenigmarchaeota archaeon]